MLDEFPLDLWNLCKNLRELIHLEISTIALENVFAAPLCSFRKLTLVPAPCTLSEISKLVNQIVQSTETLQMLRFGYSTASAAMFGSLVSGNPCLEIAEIFLSKAL